MQKKKENWVSVVPNSQDMWMFFISVIRYKLILFLQKTEYDMDILVDLRWFAPAFTVVYEEL